MRRLLLVAAAGVTIGLLLIRLLHFVTPPPSSREGGETDLSSQARLSLPPPSAAGAGRPRAHTPPTGGPGGLVALVIDDLGMDRRRTAEAIALPSVVTLAFLPYAPGVAEQVAAARARGHEILVHLPMEPAGPADPGPMALTTTLDRERFLARLSWNLTRFDGYVGVNNHMGSRLTADRRAMRWLMRDLRARGLIFLDSRTTPATVAAEVAAAEGVPHAVRRVFLDHERGRRALRAAYARIRRLAREEPVVAIGHPHRRTLAHIRRWLRRAARDGLVYVPITTLMRPSRSGLARREPGAAGGR